MAPLLVAIVEQDPDVLDTMASMVVALGHAVVGFEHAHALFVHDHFDEIDLFLLDIGNGGIDAICFVQTLTSRPEAAHKSVIALANHAQLSRGEQLRAGIDMVVRKPVSIDELSRAIAAVSGLIK